MVLLLTFPSVTYTLIIVGLGIQSSEADGRISDNLVPLYSFIAGTRGLLLLLFYGSGIALLRSLKWYSLKIYRLSKYKVRSNADNGFCRYILL